MRLFLLVFLARAYPPVLTRKSVHFNDILLRAWLLSAESASPWAHLGTLMAYVMTHFAHPLFKKMKVPRGKQNGSAYLAQGSICNSSVSICLREW